MLLNENATARKKDGKGQINWSLSYHTLKECYYTLETPECVTASIANSQVKRMLGDLYISLPGSKDKHSAYISCTDANYWQVFRFSFLDGKPYNADEFESGFRKAVINESMARKLFDNTSGSVVGKSFLINDLEYVVGAVVKDVSPAMKIVFADIWIPFTSMSVFTQKGEDEDIVGVLRAYILAHKPSDFDIIRDELEQKRKKINTTLTEYEFVLKDGVPCTQKQEVIRNIDYSSSNNEIIMRYLFIVLIFLLVPAVNLSGLTSSRMQERISEIGIRKAFGATRNTLINQILTENLFLTLCGGLFGLIISYTIILVLNNSLFISRYSTISGHVVFSQGMLMNFTVFFYAFMVCIILNLASSIIPVLNISRKNIVEAINDK